MKIAMLISGGVDSSVSLRLLKDAGHDVHAFYLKVWLEDDARGEMSAFMGECPWEEDLFYIRRVCEVAHVPLTIIPMQKEYWDRVVTYTVSMVKSGLTPNPDVMCNQHIKFGAFFDRIDGTFEKVATGHYAQVEEKNGKFFLRRAPDPVKDQTYFLSLLSQKELSRAMFPIGHMMKKEVRALAEKYDLPNKERKDSQGVCFLGKISFDGFLEHYLGKKCGKIVEKSTGKELGEHNGYYFYTIGQRHGLKLSGGPWYVTSKDIEKNIVYVAHGENEHERMREEFDVANIHWISECVPHKNTLLVKIRHAEKLHSCQITAHEKSNSHVRVKLSEPDLGLAPGQFAVFYDGEVCFGGGVIQ